jgi:putative aldouronate transport system permease protein
LHVLLASISDSTDLAQHRGLIFRPIGKMDFTSYKKVFENPMISKGYKNTLIYLISGTTINVFLTALGAYALSRKYISIGKYIMLGIVFTMIFNGGMIPTYMLIKNLGMTNTMWALIIPNAISAWNLVIMRTSFQAVPMSMEESAKIDGANDFVILFRIFIPLSSAVMAVMILFYGVGHWNSWLPAMLYIRSRELYPLQLVLREILLINSTQSMTTDIASSDDQANIGETIKYATVIVATLPILAIYPFLQKYFVKGVMVGAIKG